MRLSRIIRSTWILAIFGFSLPLPHIGYAATFMVNSTADRVDNNLGDTNCNTGQSTPPERPECTLRAAIQETNVLAGGDTIILPGGIYQVTIPGANEDAAASGDLDILDNLTIIGTGRDQTFIDGGGLDRVFDIISPASSGQSDAAIDVTIAHVTVRNGTASGGGGIRYASYLTVTNSVISDNQSTYNGGGLASTNYVFQNPRLTLLDSTVTRNKGTSFAGDGGGIDAVFGEAVTIERSVISNNLAKGFGGGLAVNKAELVEVTVSGNIADGTVGIGGGIWGCVTMTRSTISGNLSSWNGGGIQSSCATITGSLITNNTSGTWGGGIGNSGTLVLTDVRVVNNLAAQGAGGIYQFGSGSSTTITNSIITNNLPSNCGGLVTC